VSCKEIQYALKVFRDTLCLKLCHIKSIIFPACNMEQEACKQIIRVVWRRSAYRVLTNEREGIKGIKSETRNQ
jgi:hypothetical protein